MNANLIIIHADELSTCRGFEARAGKAMNALEVIRDGAVRIEDGTITAVGPTADVMATGTTDGFAIIDASGKAVLPGFVDSHTHFIFGGYRAEEFTWRLQGMHYMDIMAQGGGIASTVKATRQADLETLVAAGRRRLDAMLAFGVTTVEGKSGYGLDRDTEIRQLEAIAVLEREHPMDIVPTFLGAHAVPREYRDRSDAYIDFIMATVLPEVAARGLAEFCDIFCEDRVFSVAQSRRLLKRAKGLGLKLTLHADEIVALGGAELAAEMGAVSADHLLQVSDDGIRDMAAAGVVASLLPLTAFGLKEPCARGRTMIDRGCAVALATDFNPGSCFSNSIPLLMALATLYMGLTPEEALTAITLNGAAAVDRAERIGSLEAGKQGDVVILEYPSHRFIPYHLGVNIVEKVVKRGRLVFDKEQGGPIHFKNG
ncbi:MAG: imidazolonepropionase [Desulfosarcina sp.]|nr:imidazolonepropionase [Desulfobacterales bacterium]